jgi:hypothetical protein
VTTPAGTPIHPQFRIIDGLSIRFTESEGRNDDALLLSPWPESLFAFEPIWAPLADHAHLVAIDLPGFCHSERRDDLLSPARDGRVRVAPRAGRAALLRQRPAVGGDRVRGGVRRRRRRGGRIYRTGRQVTKPAPAPGPSPLSGTRAERVRRPRLARSAAFWLEAAVLVLFLAASAAPTPLYRVYQARWGFSAATLTAVFAVYVLFLLMTVLIFGSLSDHVGRRPVIITALAVDAAACILFLLAHGVGALFSARALQGVAVGLAASALGAALLDLRPAGSLAPLVTSNGGTVGLALGALGTSVLVQYGPVPTHLV